MKRGKFNLWHSVLGAAVFAIVEGILLTVATSVDLRITIILIAALVGGTAHVVVATEVIEEVRNARHLLALLSGVVAIFVGFFAFQYWYLTVSVPGSFPGLGSGAVDLLLHSTMVFVFNPIYLPVTAAARTLLLINTLGALTLVLFILQNVWQIRGKNT